MARMMFEMREEIRALRAQKEDAKRVIVQTAKEDKYETGQIDDGDEWIARPSVIAGRCRWMQHGICSVGRWYDMRILRCWWSSTEAH